MELEQGEVEAGESDLDYKARFKCCQSLAAKSHANQVYGIESTCLTKCAQIAASAKHYKELRQLRSRIENVEDTIEGDFPTLLSDICGQWRPDSREDWGFLLKWFQGFDCRFPLSPFLLGDVSHPPKPDEWNIPVWRCREERIEYSYYLTIGAANYAQESLQRASTISQFVDWEFNACLNLRQSWLFEWEEPISGSFMSVHVRISVPILLAGPVRKG